MTKDILSFERAVLIDWSDELNADDVCLLLHELERARQAIGAPLVAILSISQDVPGPSARVLDALATSLPRIFGQCQKFLLALPPITLRHRYIRSIFLTHAVRAVALSRVLLCDSLPEALQCAGRLAPAELFELQRALLARSAATECPLAKGWREQANQDCSAGDEDNAC